MSDQTTVDDNITWDWQTWEGLPYLTCSLLKKWPHGFFTQQFWPQAPVELTKVLWPNAPVYRVKQVHSNKVLYAAEATPVFTAEAKLESGCAQGGSKSDKAEGTYPEADGLVTTNSEEAVWVCSADCVPVLIADGETGRVGAVHAGWRGTATKIVPEAIASFEANGSRLSDLYIAMGPAISGEVYQVSEEVGRRVGATAIDENVKNSTEDILECLRQLPNSPLFPDPQPGRVRLDLRRINALQLEQLGISLAQIAIAPNCTYQDGQNFFSYRRDKLKKVQWSGIVSIKANSAKSQ